MMFEFDFDPHNNTVPLSLQNPTGVYLLKFQLDQLESPSDIHRCLSTQSALSAGRGGGRVIT